LSRTDDRVPPWRISGELLGSCNCDWGCPCNFQAPPTQGYCDGFYTIVVDRGSFGDVPLDGAVFVTGGHTPGAIHEGDGTSILLLDEGMSPEQRDAVQRLWRGDGVGSPFDEFASVTTLWHEPIVAPIQVHLDGIRSTVQVAGGSVYDLALERTRNPVTGEEEITIFEHPTGFSSKRSELGTSSVATFNAPEIAAWDHTGRYAEYARIEYEGPPG
jgi:hypothetical protein